MGEITSKKDIIGEIETKIGVHYCALTGPSKFCRFEFFLLKLFLHTQFSLASILSCYHMCNTLYMLYKCSIIPTGHDEVSHCYLTMRINLSAYTEHLNCLCGSFPSQKVLVNQSAEQALKSSLSDLIFSVCKTTSAKKLKTTKMEKYSILIIALSSR